MAPRTMGMAVSPWSPRLRLDCPPEVFSGETPAPVSGEALAMSSQCLLLPLYLLFRKTSTSFPVFIVQIGNASGSLSLSWLTPQTTRKTWCGSGGSQQLKEAICGLRLCMSTVLTCMAETWVSRSLGCCSSPITLYFIYINRESFFYLETKQICLSYSFLKSLQ